MPATKRLEISELALDLLNPRTVQQEDESQALRALIAIKPTYFWGLMESILDEGYEPTENILVSRDADGKNLVVKEGNRRVASLKLILGLLKLPEDDIPSHLQEKIAALSEEWKADNRRVPCVVFGPSESRALDSLVSRIHGKGESAGRLKWDAIARARHARDHNEKSEPGLDLLEAYIKQGRNVTEEQAERWPGEFPITVLDEFVK